MMKKWFAMILLAAMVFSTLSACSDKVQQDQVEEDEELEETESEYRDFYEQEFWAAYAIGTGEYNFFWPEPTTKEKEDTRKISEHVEQLLNCKLLEEGFHGQNAGFWAAKMATGDYRFSWAPTQNDMTPIYSFYSAGFIQSWNDIPGVDLSNAELWGSPSMQKLATFGGEVYAAVSGARGGHYGKMFYNKILAQELNPMVLPQDLYEQKNWTWETFEDYLASVTLKDAERTVYGLSINPHGLENDISLALCAVFTNGGDVVKFDSTGKAVFGLTSPEAIEAIQWAADLSATDYVVYDGSYPPALWANEGAVLMLGDSSFGTGTSGSSKHWGLDNLEDLRCIPFPQGPKGDGSVGGAYATSVMGEVMLFGVDKEDSGYVWGVFKGEKLAYQADTEEEWKRKTFFQDDANDSDSYNNWVFTAENFNSDYTAQIGTAMTKLREAVSKAVHGEETPTQAMTSVQTLVQSELDLTMNVE